LQPLREVWTKNFKTSPAEEDDVEMTGDGEGSGEPSRDEDDFEKQIRLANVSHEAQVRPSPSWGVFQSTGDRLISLRSGYWKTQFLTSRTTTSVRKASFTTGVFRDIETGR
jgi:hypothetical protein